MAEYTYILDTEHIYPNLTIKKILCDGVLSGYDLTTNEGYVMYRTDANDKEPATDEFGNFVYDDEGNLVEIPVIYYYKHALLPPNLNFDTQFTWVAVLRSTVDENYIFSVGDKPEIM